MVGDPPNEPDFRDTDEYREFSKGFDETFEKYSKPLPVTVNGHDFIGKFIVDQKRQILRGHPQNTRVALEGLGVTLQQNDFTGAPEVAGVPGIVGDLTDATATRIRFLISENFSFLPPKELFEDVLVDVAHQNRYHPVRELLNSLEWDGVPRIDNWLIAYGGAEDTAFNRSIGRTFLVAGVRRVKRPGCKFDTMLVLEGPQGRNKSQAAEALAMKREWFTDGLSLDADPKVVIEQTKGSWIIEFAELTGMHTRGLERIKAFLSRNVDKARAAYGRRAEAIPRQFVGIGTTNDREYLRRDERRLWPVTIREFDLAMLRRDVTKLWAEAAHYEADGEEITLPEDLWAEASATRSERIILDPIKDVLADRLGDQTGWISAKYIWIILDVQPDRRHMMTVAVGNAMAELGFTIRQVWGRYDPKGQRGSRYYERGLTEAERAAKIEF